MNCNKRRYGATSSTMNRRRLLHYMLCSRRLLVMLLVASNRIFASGVTPCFGTATGPNCQCPRLQYGQFCQFYDECSVDTDCGMAGQGKCVDLKNSGYPKKVCYCTAPYFGKHCEKKFEPRPEDLSQNCFNYKFTAGQIGVNNQQNLFTGKGLYNAQCYHKANIIEENVFVYWRHVFNEIEMIMDYPGQSWVGVGWRPDYLNGRCQEFPVINDEPLAARYKRENKTGPRSSSAPSASAEPEPHHPRKGPSAEPEPEPEAPASLHPMDCTDIVIGSAYGNLSRAADMYTRDRSTPLDDAIYKGKDDLTAVFGIETSGRTVIMFRRPVTGSDKSDHDLNGDMRMIWARGQQPSEKQAVGHPEFYEPDVLKYHGGNRGSFLISFTAGGSADNGTVNDLKQSKTQVPAAQTGLQKNQNKKGNNNSSAKILINSNLLFATLINFAFILFLTM